MNTKLRRSVVALATACACLVLMASPASATTHTVAVTGGSITLVNATSTSTLALPWAGSSSTLTDCGSTLVIDETATAYDVTQYASASRGTILLGSYVALVTRTASTAGTVTGTTLDASATLSLRIRFFTPANGTDCTTTGTVLCTYNVTVHLDGTVAGWTGSSTGTLNNQSAGLAVTPPCSPPFATFIGGSVAAGSVTFHV